MTSTIKNRSGAAVLLQTAAAALLALAGGQATAASVTLCAEPYTVNLPGAAGVPMWGYRPVADAASCSATSALRPDAAAPVITMPAGDSTLSVTLVNRLTVPTSVVIAGQAMPADGGPPVMAEDLVGPSCDPSTLAMPARLACRVRSFTGETEPGASRTYTFNNVRPGTFLLQTGTHPQAQLQMGLYALVKQDAAPLDGTARRLYNAAATDTHASFDVDATVVLAEVDPAQHALIASTLGTAGQEGQWKAGGNSTLNYAPKHFLINGRPFDGSNVSATDIGVNAPNGSRVVLRLANAGLQSRSLVLTSGTWRLLTEDGSPYAAPREQATALLPAGKTSDAAVVAVNTGAVGSTATMGALFDRRGGADSATGAALGGQVARLMATNSATLNRPPVVNAGADQSLVYLGAPLAASLSGTVSDDGLAQPLALTWSASGPAAVALASPNAAATAATFGAPGDYTLRLAAYDGEFTTVDELLVRVVPPLADLSVTKTNGSTRVNAGASTTYTITVSNAGPTAVAGATVVDNMPAALTNVSWTCAPAASCAAASGTGNLNSTVSLGVGGSATFAVTGTVDATATGALTNGVTVSVPAGASDPNLANNSATDTDTIDPAPPTLPLLDNFNRANANTLGANWQQYVLLANAGVRVNANQAFCVNTGLQAALCALGANAYWSLTDFGAHQAAALTFANATLNGASLHLKAHGTFNALGYYLNSIRVRYSMSAPSSVIVETTSNGIGFTQQAAFAATFASGDRLIASSNADGSVQVWKSNGAAWSYLGTTGPLSAFTGGGRVGMRLPPGARVDDFSAAALP